MTKLQRERLDAACAALTAAGAEKLPDRLRLAFTMRHQDISDVLAQARSLMSLHPGRVVARDAIGLLWAALEDEEP